MITLTMDLVNKCWHKSGSADSSDVTVEFYMVMDPVDTPFKNFGHSFDLKGLGAYTIGDKPAVVTIDADIPEPADGETIFPFLVERHFIKNLYPDEEYTLELMFKNRREVIQDTFSFTVPRPPKPYDSWVWNSDLKDWVAPAAPPTPVWDENSQKWILP